MFVDSVAQPTFELRLQHWLFMRHERQRPEQVSRDFLRRQSATIRNRFTSQLQCILSAQSHHFQCTFTALAGGNQLLQGRVRRLERESRSFSDLLRRQRPASREERSLNSLGAQPAASRFRT